MALNNQDAAKLVADIRECCRLISYSLNMDLDIRMFPTGDPLILRDNEYTQITTLNLVEVSNLGSDFTKLARLLEAVNEHK